jgi:GMP synthase (glutamine-hydrolysing)
MNRPVIILRHVAEESAGTLADALSGADLPIRYVDLFHNPPEQLPLAEAAGLVVLGGPMNADEVELYPFLKLDIEWIQQAIKARLPLLGICLGSQLLAKALGGKVYRNPAKEIGWYPVELLSAAAIDPLFAQSGMTTVYQSHGDTFDLPQGAVLLASGASCKPQAFRWGANAYGLQFHIEMTAAMIGDWLSTGEENGELAVLDYINPRAIRQQTPSSLPDMQRLAAGIFGRFAEMCLAGRTAT